MVCTEHEEIAPLFIRIVSWKTIQCSRFLVDPVLQKPPKEKLKTSLLSHTKAIGKAHIATRKYGGKQREKGFTYAWEPQVTKGTSKQRTPCNWLSPHLLLTANRMRRYILF